MVKTIVSHERICPVCGKAFYYYPEWVYKRNSKILCSWKCLRFDEKNRKRPPKMEERKRQILEMLGQSMTVAEIAKKIGLEERTIYYWKDRLAKEGLLRKGE